MNKKQSDEMEKFIRNFKSYKKHGVKFKINGEEIHLKKIAKICTLKEDGEYMSDFIGDDSGKVIEIHFHQVKSRYAQEM
ncbi:hypothetical protein FACS189418_4030 [Clostridia bacterium]|nr:hypothetical protein FACS189418_4030 [Clostridia bacterium]